MTPKAVRYRSRSCCELVRHVQKVLAFPERNLLTIDLQTGPTRVFAEKHSAPAGDKRPRWRRESEIESLKLCLSAPVWFEPFLVRSSRTCCYTQRQNSRSGRSPPA